MLVICSNCEARLQLDESKIPSQTFKVRCPKCQAGIDVRPAAGDTKPEAPSLPAEMTPPAPKISPFQRPIAAAQFKPEAGNMESSYQSDPVNALEVARLLAAALRQHDSGTVKTGTDQRPGWDRRKVLVCTSPGNSEVIAKGLVTQDYDIFVAETSEEALGRMREDQIDILILESNFDPVEQGFAFVTREVKLMRPSQRRRLFLIYVTPSARTMDLHAAFLHNANLVINPADVECLPDALESSMRHYNELYRDFNRALDMPAI